MTDPANPSPTTLVVPSGQDVITEVKHLLPYLGDLVTREGGQTSEFWVTVLTKPVAGVVSFLVAFLVAHSLIDNETAQAVSASVVSAVVTLLSGLCARAYVASRTAVKTEALRLLQRLHGG